MYFDRFDPLLTYLLAYSLSGCLIVTYSEGREGLEGAGWDTKSLRYSREQNEKSTR